MTKEETASEEIAYAVDRWSNRSRNYSWCVEDLTSLLSSVFVFFHVGDFSGGDAFMIEHI